MAVSLPPWWCTADTLPAGATARPIHSCCAPTVDPEIASDRAIPGVCAVAEDRSTGRTARSGAYPGACCVALLICILSYKRALGQDELPERQPLAHAPTSQSCRP